MKKKEALQNAIILPIATGLILAIFLCVYFNSNFQHIIPVPQNTVLAYHDSMIIDSSAKAEWDELTPNASIGDIELGNTTLALCYEADYFNLVGSVSVLKESTAFNEIGSAYLKTTTENAKLFQTSKDISVNSEYGSHKYKLADELEFNNEFEVKSYAPSLPKSLVVYYQGSNGAGLSSTYNAMIFEEVE